MADKAKASKLEPLPRAYIKIGTLLIPLKNCKYLLLCVIKRKDPSFTCAIMTHNIPMSCLQFFPQDSISFAEVSFSSEVPFFAKVEFHLLSSKSEQTFLWLKNHNQYIWYLRVYVLSAMDFQISIYKSSFKIFSIYLILMGRAVCDIWNFFLQKIEGIMIREILRIMWSDLSYILLT